MEVMKIFRALAALCALGLLVACSDEIPGGLVTGQFIDSEVAGLGYECGDDATRHVTTEAGEFTCPVGVEVRFYVGELLLGSVTATADLEVVTPVTLVGGSLTELLQYVSGEAVGEPSVEFLMGVYMSILLQSLDEDGDPENGIVIPADAHGLFAAALSWEYDEEQGGEDLLMHVFGALEDAEIELVHPESALHHLAEQSAKLLHGRYSGSVTDGDDTLKVDLFVFDRMNGEDIGLEARMITSFREEREPTKIRLDSMFHESEEGVFSVDFSLEGVVVKFYDWDAIEEDQVEITEETTPADLEDYVLHTVNLERDGTPPDVDLVDVAEFLATLPIEFTVPEGIEEFEYGRVAIFALEDMPEIPQGLESPQVRAGYLDLSGHAKKVGLTGSVGSYQFGEEGSGGHLMLASMDDDAMVYEGRVLYWYLDDSGVEPVEVQTWGDASVTVGVDGSVSIDVTGDDGSGFEATYTVEEVGVYQEV
jgi:hypothetical protein